MDMSWSYGNVHHSPLYNWTLLFCVFWPFASFSFLSRRSATPAPIAAVLLTVALPTGLMWVGFINVVRGMAITGAGRGAAAAAGFAEALFAPLFSAFSIVVIAVSALIRRHRPVVDRVCAALAAGVIAELAGALLFPRYFSLSMAWIAIAGAITSLLIAILAAVWLVLLTRGRVQPRAIPFGVSVVAASFAIMAVIVYQHARHYMFIAMHGIRW